MLYLELFAAGAAGGFLAGLLGIGGGFVVVPVLMLLLPSFGIAPDHVPKVAVATSLAAMVPTACAAVLAQVRRGNFDLAWARRLAPSAAIGAIIGTTIATQLHGAWVAAIFSAYAGYFAVKMLRDSPALPADRKPRPIPPAPVVGVVIGAFSAVAGVGGASMTIPFLLFADVDMKRAVAIASTVGLAIAIAGAAAFAATSTPTMSSPSLVGFVCWPAALALAASAMLMAPRGVAASHRLPVRHLKRAFGAVLVIACATMLLKAGSDREPIAYAASPSASITR